jgi:hypothetical protein
LYEKTYPAQLSITRRYHHANCGSTRLAFVATWTVLDRCENFVHGPVEPQPSHNQSAVMSNVVHSCLREQSRKLRCRLGSPTHRSSCSKMRVLLHEKPPTSKMDMGGWFIDVRTPKVESRTLSAVLQPALGSSGRWLGCRGCRLASCPADAERSPSSCCDPVRTATEPSYPIRLLF